MCIYIYIYIYIIRYKSCYYEAFWRAAWLPQPSVDGAAAAAQVAFRGNHLSTAIFHTSNFQTKNI